LLLLFFVTYFSQSVNGAVKYLQLKPNCSNTCAILYHICRIATAYLLSTAYLSSNIKYLASCIRKRCTWHVPNELCHVPNRHYSFACVSVLNRYCHCLLFCEDMISVYDYKWHMSHRLLAELPNGLVSCENCVHFLSCPQCWSRI